MSDNGNNFPEIPFGNRDDANGMASQALRQWAERYYAKMVEEKQAEEEPSMLDQLLDKVGEYVDQEIEQLPAEEQEAAVMKLAETADTYPIILLGYNYSSSPVIIDTVPLGPEHTG